MRRNIATVHCAERERFRQDMFLPKVLHKDNDGWRIATSGTSADWRKIESFDPQASLPDPATRLPDVGDAQPVFYARKLDKSVRLRRARRLSDVWWQAPR